MEIDRYRMAIFSLGQSNAKGASAKVEIQRLRLEILRSSQLSEEEKRGAEYRLAFKAIIIHD